MADEELPITINTLGELARHEADIIARINRLPNGGNLFMAHPFLLLTDIGVRIGDGLRAELIRHDRYLMGLSETPYRSLQGTTERLRVRYHVRKLFRARPS
jgi:hypothetical protein